MLGLTFIKFLSISLTFSSVLATSGCPLSVVLLDTWGDSWNGARFVVKSSISKSKTFSPKDGDIVVAPLHISQNETVSLSISTEDGEVPKEFWEIKYSFTTEIATFIGSYNSRFSLTCAYANDVGDNVIVVLEEVNNLSEKTCDVCSHPKGFEPIPYGGADCDVTLIHGNYVKCTYSPTTIPTTSPTSDPTLEPTPKPTVKPTTKPSGVPTRLPTSLPTTLPSSRPTTIPSNLPSSRPTAVPLYPTSQPTVVPTSHPSTFTPTHTSMPIHTREPIGPRADSGPKQDIIVIVNQLQGFVKTDEPTRKPTTSPTSNPTSIPTSIPSSHGPTSSPSSKPTIKPTVPSYSPTNTPTIKPTSLPSSVSPTKLPTLSPTVTPTRNPTSKPTLLPSRIPSLQPNRNPTSRPTRGPTTLPTRKPTLPTRLPTQIPSSASPTIHPTNTPTAPTFTPTLEPTESPSLNTTQLAALYAANAAAGISSISKPKPKPKGGFSTLIVLRSEEGYGWNVDDSPANTYYSISDISRTALISEGTICGSYIKEICLEKLEDGEYIFRVGGNGDDYKGINSWEFCGLTGGAQQELKFSWEDGECTAGELRSFGEKILSSDYAEVTDDGMARSKKEDEQIEKEALESSSEATESTTDSSTSKSSKYNFFSSVDNEAILTIAIYVGEASLGLMFVAFLVIGVGSYMNRTVRRGMTLLKTEDDFGDKESSAHPHRMPTGDSTLLDENSTTMYMLGLGNDSSRPSFSDHPKLDDNSTNKYMQDLGRPGSPVSKPIRSTKAKRGSTDSMSASAHKLLDPLSL